MKKGLKILISIIVVIIIFVGGWYLMINAPYNPNKSKINYQLKNSPYNNICNGLNTEECKSDEKCIPFITSSCRQCEDLIYEGCYGLTDKQIEDKHGNCNNACIEQGFSKGSCQTLSVIENPCEMRLNKTTITSYDGYCENKPYIGGISNTCCCE